MKIIHSILRYYPAMGGVEEYLRRLLEGMVRRGHQVKVYTTNLKYERQGRIDVTETNLINGVEVRRYNPAWVKPKGYVFVPGLFRALLKEKADIIHGHAYMHYPADAAMFVGKLKKIPFVFNPFFVDVGKNSLWRKAYRCAVGKHLMLANTVITISPYEEMIIKQNGFSTKKIKCIPPGIDINEFDNVAHNIYEKYNLKDNIVLFTGRYDYYKGIDVLIKAAPLILKEIPEARFFLVGPNWGYQGELCALVKALNIEDKVIFAGVLSRSDLISAYKNATVFAFPSRYELFGIVLIEAMASGVPIVAANSSAIPYIVKDEEEALLFESESHVSLAQQILRLLKDSALRTDLAAQAKVLVEQDYSLNESVNKLEQLYYQLNLAIPPCQKNTENIVSCPVCQSSSKVFYIRKHANYDIWHCRGCQIQFSDPMIEPGELFYKQSSIYENRREESVMDRGMRSYDWRYHNCLKLCNPKAHKLLLDIGCGDGKFMALAYAKGFDVFGIDMDERAIDFAKHMRNFQNVQKSTWEEITGIENWKDFNFEIITLFDVLEHVSSPASLVNTIFKLLKPGGIVFVTVPRMDRYPQIFDSEIDSPPHHFTLWTANALKILLKKSGFSNIQVLEKPLMSEDLLLHIIKRAKRLLKRLTGCKVNARILTDAPKTANSKQKGLNFMKKSIFYGLIPVVILVNWFCRVFRIGRGHTLLLKAKKP